jgi:hypothetical protein
LGYFFLAAIQNRLGEEEKPIGFGLGEKRHLSCSSVVGMRQIPRIGM